MYMNTSNKLDIIEDIFLFVRNVIGIKPNEMIGTLELLKRMLSFMNDIQKNGSDSIILAYTDLLGEYMRIVKAAYISTEAEKQIIEIVNHFFLEAIDYIFDQRILYHLSMILYYNNLVIFLTEDNQKKIIHNFYSYYQGNQITKAYEGKEIDKKIIHLLLLCMIDIFSIKPFLFESNNWINLLPSHPYLIEILISSIIPVEQRENLFQWDFMKEQSDINEVQGILQNLYIFDYIKYHFVQLISMNQSDKIVESYKMINCVLTKIVNLKEKPIYFDTLFNQNSDICNEIYKEMLLFNQSVGKEVTKMEEIVNRISLASEKQITFLADLIAISQLLVLHHKNSFIYKFLNEIIDLNDQSMSAMILKLILSIMNSLSIISDKYNEIYINNLCQMVIVLYNCAFTETTKKFYFDIQFRDSFSALCEGIRDVHLLYTRVRLTEKNRTICEYLFEIFIEILDCSKDKNYIILFGYIFLVDKSNDLKNNFVRYYNEFLNNKKIPKNTNTLFYFLDCQNLKNHPKFPDRATIEKVEKIMNDQFEKKQQNYKINYTVFFYIKIMYYLVYKKENANSKSLLSLIERILYDDIKHLKAEHSTRSLYYTNSTKNSMFDNIRKCIDDNIKNKKDCNAIRECFIKITDGIKGTESLTDYKKFTYFSLYDTGKLLTDNSGDSNSLLSSKKNASTTSLENCLKERTLSSPNGLQRSNTASNVSELNLVIEENKSFNTEPKETSKKKKGGGIFGFFSFSGKKDNPKKEEKPINIITSSDNKEVTPKIRLVNGKTILKSFDEIHMDNLVLCPKKQILLKRFSIYFKNIFFNCPMFKRIKERFIIDYVPYLPNSKTKVLNYPTKLRNFCNSEEPPLFYKLDQNFYTSDFFRVSHKYALSIVDKNAIQRIPFNQRSLKVKENIKQFDCELINVENSLYGGVKITKEFFLFEDNKDDPRKSNDIDQKIKYIFSSISMDTAYKKKQFIIFYKEINEIVVRRFLFLWQAVEIFLKDGKSYFLNFFSKRNCDEFLDLISSFLEDSSIIITQEKAYDLIKQYQDQWVKGLISTYNYLLKINKYGTRSYKDTNQYPLFPWVILKQSDIFNDLVLFTEQELEEYKEKRREKKRMRMKLEKKGKASNEKIIVPPRKSLALYRDFNYPIAFQSDEKKEQAIIKYKESMKEEKFPIHSRLHYSTSSYVSYYLVRENPFINSLIKLQNYCMENPNRTFDSIFNTQKILENTTDCRELIPEFFCTMEFMINFNCCFYGIKTDKSIVDDVISQIHTKTNNNKDTKKTSDTDRGTSKDTESAIQSKKAFADYIKTLIFNRRIINNSQVAKGIINWINYIFGVNQLTKKAESCNTFEKYSYSQNINLEDKLKKYEKKYQDNKSEIFERLNNKINLIINFGQTPLQLFKHLHPQRESEKDKTETDDIESLTYLISRGGNKKLISKDEDDRLIYINDYISDKLLLCFTKKKKIIIADINIDRSVKDIPSIVVQLHFKLGEKITKNILDLKKNSYKVYYYLDSLDYAYISLPHTNSLITCRYLDNSFKFHSLKEGAKEQKEYSIVTEDFVSAIGKISNQKFIIGLNNGKIIEYELELLPSKSYKCIEKRFLLAHEGRVRVIEYYKTLNILITAGDDGYIFIRKAYNFELLSIIKVDEGFKVISCKVSDCNLLYVFCCNYASNDKKNLIIGYTLNGIEFARSKERYYTNITLLDNGNLVAGEITEKIAYIFNGYNLADKARTKCNFTENKYFTNFVSYIQYFNSKLYTTYEFRTFGCLKIEKNTDFN